jgi:hypothetical protein
MEPLDITLSLFQAMKATMERAEQHGWAPAGGSRDGMVCPSCARGGTPVTDRGDCPVCTGMRRCRDSADRCVFCGHTTPYPEEEEWDGHRD